MFISVTSKVMNVNRLKAAPVYEVKVQSFCKGVVFVSSALRMRSSLSTYFLCNLKRVLWYLLNYYDLNDIFYRSLS